MKTRLTILLFLLFLISPLSAQVKEIFTNVWGGFDVLVEIKGQGYVMLNQEGEIIEVELKGEYTYYGKRDIFTDNLNRGKISKAGNLRFEYYDTRNIFTDNHNRGKVSRIGDIRFTYYDDRQVFTDLYNEGMIARIDRLDFRYYDKRSVFQDEFNEGKIKSIGRTEFTYYDRRSWHPEDHALGKIEKVDNERYIYYHPLHAPPRRGEIKEGNKHFKTKEGFYITFVEGRRR